MKYLIAVMLVTWCAQARARELIVDNCDARLDLELAASDIVLVRCSGAVLMDRATAAVLRDQTARLAALELRNDEAMHLAMQASENAVEAARTSRGFRLASYAAGFTIGAVGGGLTSSEMTTKPGLVAAGTAIGAVIGTAFVLLVDQVFLQ